MGFEVLDLEFSILYLRLCRVEFKKYEVSSKKNENPKSLRDFK